MDEENLQLIRLAIKSLKQERDALKFENKSLLAENERLQQEIKVLEWKTHKFKQALRRKNPNDPGNSQVSQPI